MLERIVPFEPTAIRCVPSEARRCRSLELPRSQPAPGDAVRAAVDRAVLAHSDPGSARPEEREDLAADVRRVARPVDAVRAREDQGIAGEHDPPGHEGAAVPPDGAEGADPALRGLPPRAVGAREEGPVAPDGHEAAGAPGGVEQIRFRRRSGGRPGDTVGRADDRARVADGEQPRSVPDHAAQPLPASRSPAASRAARPRSSARHRRRRRPRTGRPSRRRPAGPTGVRAPPGRQFSPSTLVITVPAAPTATKRPLPQATPLNRLP